MPKGKFNSVRVMTGFVACAWLVFLMQDAQAKSFSGTAFQVMPGKDSLKKSSSVELQADQVNFSSSDNKAAAQGKVVVKNGEETLYCDTLDLDRSKQQGVASGHVYLDAPLMQVDADKATYNFDAKTGQFENARIFNDPLQVKGKVVTKVSETHTEMQDGYMTTCDHDIPHFRMVTKHMDVYQGDKAVARHVIMYIGKVPVMYLPRYTQDLKNRPWFSFAPGHAKDLGYFLLTRSRMRMNDHLTTTLRVDLYERQGIGWGLENKYTIPNKGQGTLKTYFINERSIGAKHPWKMKTIPTVQNERNRLEWRHKWDIDQNTNAIWQYYRLSDNVLLKRYFVREFRTDPSADTYFLLTRNMPGGALSFRVDHRVNRFVSAIDRTPEIKYEVSAQPIARTGLYLKSTNSFVDLVNRQASPTEDRRKAIRADTDNEVSYPTKVSFIQFRPFVGGDTTYYTRTNDAVHKGKILRGTFKTGADFGTMFLKVINVHKDVLGIKLNQLRHIVSPSVAYKYQHEPSFRSSRLNTFDEIDSIGKVHTIGYSLENKLQTKQGKNTVDLLRALTTATYQVLEKGVKGGLGSVTNLVEANPYSWLKLVSETTYDHKKDHFASGNFDAYFSPTDKLQIDFGNRYTRLNSNEFVNQVSYTINPKWRIKTFDRFNRNRSTLVEEGYTITRDLHEWEVNFTYNQIRGGGTEVLVIFTLKAFPDRPFDLFGTSFHQRKAGSQSSEQQIR